MLCRVLLAAIGISYLVCVLFLSGIQKEDLEVSLLKKMRHYDINFDKNNELLRTECLNNTQRKKKQNDSDQNTTEKEKEVTITTNTPNKAVTLDTSELKSVLKYLKHKKKIRDPFTTESYKWKNFEKRDEVISLFENLMSENNDNVKKIQDSVISDSAKQSSLEDIKKHSELHTRKLDASRSETQLANTHNATIKKNLTETVKKLADNATKEPINKDFDISNLKNQIGQIFAEFLSKKNTLLITTQPVSEKMITEPPQINAQEIEQKFAISIAAINKLNENIAILQKNINGAKLSNPNKLKENGSNLDDLNKKLEKNVTKDTSQNVAKSIPDNLMSNAESLQNLSKLNRINNNYDIRMMTDTKIIDMNQRKVDSIKNSPIEFASRDNSSFDTLYTGYDKERHVESPILKNTKNNQIQYNPSTQDMAVPQFDYDRQKFADLFLNSKNDATYSMKNSQFEFRQKDLKDYSYEKHRIPDGINSVKTEKKYREDQLPFISDTQNIQDMINYGFYNQRQPESRINHFQYNNEGLASSLIQGGHPDIMQSYNPDKMTEDLTVPLHQNNGDIFKNNQIQYPTATHIGQEAIQSGYEKQAEPDTHVIDIQSDIDVLKNKQILLPFQIQNGKDTLNSRFDIQDELDLHIPKQENFKQYPFQTQNGRDTPSSGEPPIEKPQENLNTHKTHVNKSNDTQKYQVNSFSFDMISKIAESVKEIVLKDLKKEMMSSTTPTTAVPLTIATAKTTESKFITTAIFTSPTTSISTTLTPTMTTTTTTTTIPPTTTPTSTTTTHTVTASSKPNCTTTASPITTFTDTTIADLTNKTQKIYESKVQDATQVIQKFIQLFEQMKSVQDKSIKNNEKMLPPKMVKPKYNLPIVMYPQPLPPIDPFDIRSPPKQMPIIVHNYIPPTLNRPPFPPSYITPLDTLNSVSRIHQPPNFAVQRYPNVVMIQTNRNEIQPLGVPMVKPEAMNLNIVMTTQNPFWSRQERYRWNYMYKYGRSPDKLKDVKKVKNSFNVYSNDYVQGSKSLPSNKVLSKEIVSVLNTSKDIDDKIRLNILKQMDSYSKPENTNKNSIDEIKNRIISEVNEHNKHDTNKYQPPITNILNPNNYIDDNIIKNYINEMAKHNENVFNSPYNSGVDTKPMYNVYKDININPNNVLYGQLQNRGLIHQMDPYAYKQPRLNFFDQGQVINAGPMRLTNFQNGNKQFITKENMLDRTNQIFNSNTAPGPFNPIPNNIMDNARGQFNRHYLKSDTQVHNMNVMPMKDINYYSNQPKGYQTDQVNDIKIMPNNGVKYTGNSRPTLKNRIPKVASSEYQYVKPIKRLENRLPKINAKSSLKNNIETYYDNPSRMESMKMKEKTLVTNERNYARPPFRNPEHSNEFSSTMNKIKMKFENPRYYSNPSDEDSNREFANDNFNRPYHAIHTGTSMKNRININKQRGDEYSGFENEKHTVAQPQMDIISAVFGHLDKYKTSKERDQSFEIDRHNHENQKYRPHPESSNPKVNMKVQRPHEDSDSDYKYSGNVRGFHDKLESSDSWPDSPSDCGFDDRCMSSGKILSRYQQPLDSKKNAKYDDSRFKSFLKTQQKVNKMLEMILATKADEIHSVEHV